MRDFSISVIIPVKNGEATLERCLDSLRKQTIGDRLDIIIPDSMSTDRSRDIAVKYGAKIINVPNGSFNHGLTRNTGIKHSQAEFIYLTVQDAWIAEKNMLEKMVKHFDDIDIKAVCGHQAVPHERDKNPVNWYKPYSQPEVTLKCVQDTEIFKKLPSQEQQSIIAWDDVVSMYRTSALVEQPFVKTEFAEDWVWSYQALLKGWKLLYDPSLVVYHYHHQSFRYAFNLTYTYNYHLYKFFKYKPTLPRIVKPIIKASYHLLKNKKLSFKEKLYWISHDGFARLAGYFSTLNFLARQRLAGDGSVERGYDKYCKTVPMGIQKK
ncbi:MAG TPA: glycosyltransferase family 2 protein [Chitinophagaceae bacterium]|nr:glycosyltransferase family 2 protein [Chitinophagaceae bacterium]